MIPHVNNNSLRDFRGNYRRSNSEGMVDYSEYSEPKWVNSILNIIGVNSLRLGVLHLACCTWATFIWLCHNCCAENPAQVSLYVTIQWWRSSLSQYQIISLFRHSQWKSNTLYLSIYIPHFTSFHITLFEGLHCHLLVVSCGCYVTYGKWRWCPLFHQG